MHIAQLFPVLSARTRCRNEFVYEQRIGRLATLNHEFSMSTDTKEGIYGNSLRTPPQTISSPWLLPSKYRRDTQHTWTRVRPRAYERKHPRPLPSLYNLCACILCDKSASSLCQSAVTRFAPVGMRESYRLQGGRRKSLTFDSASCIAP